MTNKSLKWKTISSMIWSSCQKFGTLALSFFGNLILARFLTPDDYGLVGMLTVFISISETFIDSGLGAALIRKENPTEEDYSTVFWANIIISILCYTILFIFASSIANFYEMPILKEILRIKGLVLIIQSFRLIQTTKFHKNLNFKTPSIIYFVSALISTIASIVFAFLGYGVWSLVAKTLIESCLKTILILMSGKWKPLFKFSITSFKSLFSYGGTMLLTSLVLKLYSNIQSLIIGKSFSAKELGYYTQASKLENVPTSAIEGVVNQVAFPVFSQIRTKNETITKGLKKILNCVSYITFPLMVFFIICAEPIFDFLYSDVWKASIPYFKYLCLVGMMLSVNTINTNLIKAIGNKKQYFNLQVTKRLVAIVFLILSLKFGMHGLLITRVIIEYGFFVANGRVTKRITGYRIIDQIKDCLPNYILSFVLGLLVRLIFNFINLPTFAHITLQALLYFSLYLSVSVVFKYKAYKIYKDIILERIRRK